MTDNLYSPPKSEIDVSSIGEDTKPSFLARFGLTALIGFPVFMIFVLLLPKETWLVGTIGAAIFTILAGLIAICIPVKRKILFIVPSIFICVVLAYLIGRMKA
jgi:hypothetical protein